MTEDMQRAYFHHSCIFMTTLVNTCFSRQSKRKERGTFRRCGVLKLYMVLICCTFPITPQANVVQSLPSPKIFCIACRRRWINLSQGLSTLDVKNIE